MTDKELLELAAKAMGYKYMNGALWDGRDVVEYEWHPQDRDGQALRLAVKLGLCMTIDLHLDAETEVWEWGGSEAYESVSHERDPYEATRRAIVRSAAEIGKSI